MRTGANDLLDLLARLAALPADQRELLTRLLAPPAPAPAPGRSLDDKLSPGMERAAAGGKGAAPCT